MHETLLQGSTLLYFVDYIVHNAEVAEEMLKE